MAEIQPTGRDAGITLGEINRADKFGRTASFGGAKRSQDELLLCH